LFVVLVLPFCYEEKRLAQHWTSFNNNQRIHWPVACTTHGMHTYRSRHFEHVS